MQQQGNNSIGLDKIIDDRIKAVLPIYLSGNAFTQRKTTDTPNDSLEVVNRRFVTANGSVAGKPTSSVAVYGQFYLNSDTNIPMWYTPQGWRNGVGSIVAQA